MQVYGSFINQKGDEITVNIVTSGGGITREIGAEGSGLYFTDDPVVIESEVNDTFDCLLPQSAKIRLLAREFIPDFFCASARDAAVSIYRGEDCLFAGYIEPQTYSQPYNDVEDEIEISCIDALSSLRYSKYRNIGASGVLYNNIKANATQRSFYSIISEILNNAAGSFASSFYYDGSKALNSDNDKKYSIFNDINISELLFLGDEEDDVWHQNEVLEEILKYLNLHIAQVGTAFYIFSWETIKSNGTIYWSDLMGGGAMTTVRQSDTISMANVAGCDATISIGEVFNQLMLTCKIEEVEEVVESPLDTGSIVSPYINKQKYVTEIFAEGGQVEDAYLAFKALCQDQPTSYEAGATVDWYLQVMNNIKWVFPKNGSSINLIDEFCASGRNQHALPNWLGQNPGAAIIAFGSVQKNTANNDNSPTSKINMTNYLVVAVNGNGVDNDENNTYPSAATLLANAPYAKFVGTAAAGTLTPADDTVTNYIVLSGKIALNPLMEQTDNYKVLHDTEDWRGTGYLPVWWNNAVPSRHNGNGRYYTRKYWEAETPADTPVWNGGDTQGLIPFTGQGPEQYEFNYSAIGESSDTISKVAVLACMLIVGDKCVVETGTSGQVSDFVWQDYKTREECADDDEYYQQSFTIGFDPKIGDKLIGTEYSLQNNINYTLGIDAEGIAIPIRRTDKVSGQVQFMILGPVNTTWDVITRRHPTFFRHTQWSSETVPLLAHISNIMVKEFEINVYSDNGGVNNTGDNDIVYMSDTRENFVNKKDDLEFKITSALTLEECTELGVTNTINESTPVNPSTKEGILSIYDYTKSAQVKPEKSYVDSYYNEYHAPRILLRQGVFDTEKVGIFTHYTHPALSKTFFVQGISRNLMEGSAYLMLKEIDA